jgi:dTDP-4-amino-4,6-dideoxygalactose transaminase
MRVGARPVFVDVELTAAILIWTSSIPQSCHAPGDHAGALAGLAVDMDRLYSIARQRGLRVVEDAAHAIGTEYKGKRIGSFGDIQVFSFHPNKNMTTIEGALSLPTPRVGRGQLQRFHGLKRDLDGGATCCSPAASTT